MLLRWLDDMGKLQKRESSFQAGEISPRYFGRSEDDVYQKGLAVAENVLIDKRGGAFRRRGLEHFGQVDGNNARAFSLQVSRQRYYTLIAYYDIVLAQGKLLIIAAGASFLGDNLLLNGSFANAGDDWLVSNNPISSTASFVIGHVDLEPEPLNINHVLNPDFTFDGLGWTIRKSHVLSSVTFADGTVTLIPRPVGVEYAGVAQLLSVPTAAVQYRIIISGEFLGNFLDVKIGVTEGDGTYLDITLAMSDELLFTPAAAGFWITLDCINPNSAIVLDSVKIEEVTTNFVEISQEATVIALPTDEHTVVVAQQNTEKLIINIGTTQGAVDIASVISTDHEIIFPFVPNNATFFVTVRAESENTLTARVTFIGTATTSAAAGLGEFMDATWSEDQLDEIHMIESPTGRTLYFVHPNLQPQKLAYSHTSDTFTPLTNVTFSNPPAEWTDTNWPATGTHYEGRLWLAATPDQRQTMWGSVSGSDEDFSNVDDNLDPNAPTDATRVTITLREFGRIEWLLGTKNLLVGAENGEHIITSAGGVITWNDFHVEQQSSFGSNNMRGVQVGEKIFYLTPDGRKLRAMAYEFNENNWLSQDLTYISEHVTAPIAIHSCWAQHPDNLFVLVMEDGTLAIMTYARTAGTIAWTRHQIAGMDIKDVSTGRDSGISEIVVVGQRTPGKIDIELNSGGREYLDSYVGVFDAGGTDTITGLDHLEGLEVRSLVDGAVEPLQLVIGGQITTQRTGNQLYAGLDYTSKIKTLPPDVQKSQIRSWKKRWNQVYALMLDSKMPIINGVRPPDRTPSTPMDTVEPNASKHFKTVSLGWDDFGQVTIEENLPVAMNVLSIYGEMGVENL